MRADAARQVDGGGLVLLALASWLVPGGGHLWLGRRTKGIILLVALTTMFGIGLALHGRLFPFEASQPLVLLAAIADAAMGAAVLRSPGRSTWARASRRPSPTSTPTPS